MSRQRSPVGNCLKRIIGDHPGIHFRALERAADLSSAGQLRHHLDRLERSGVVVEVEDGGYKRFFISTDHDRRLRPHLARYARPIVRQIGALLIQGDLSRTELRHRLGCADSTLGYYLTRMEDEGDVVRYERHDRWCYALRDPELVQAILQVNQPAAGEIETVYV